MKKVYAAAALILIAGLSGVNMIFGIGKTPEVDSVALNEIAITAFQNGNQMEAVRILRDGMLEEQDRINDQRQRMENYLRGFLYVFVFAVSLISGVLAFYCEKFILKPFRRLNGFARNVAAGNLDIPLTMDKNNLFGAFTESFDILREELKRSRENEARANKSKKELVAALSHDIKTPVASIRAVTELMIAQSAGNESRLNVIMAKADQIDLLVTNMFHEALEELEQLKVEPAEIQSTVLYELIKNADYEAKAKIKEIPECIITADPVRLQQVFDNIISNSYKYAGTDIAVSACFEGKYLALVISDLGCGIPDDELPLVFEKFYRGKNAVQKNGAGLGLYISKYLMNRMGGNILCLRTDKGFTVKILLAM